MRVSVYENRRTFIRKYVRGKDVLDVGASELVGTINRNKMDRWPHNIIREIANSVCGLDKNHEQVLALRDSGFDVREGDAEDFDLGTSYDVIFAGEVIEHLSNPGGFLRCVRKHLRPEGILLITTPNRFSIKALKSVLLRNVVEAYRKAMDGHVAYYDIWSLRELLRREGFALKEIGYYVWMGDPSAKWVARKAYSVIASARRHLLPGIVAVAVKESL